MLLLCYQVVRLLYLGRPVRALLSLWGQQISKKRVDSRRGLLLLCQRVLLHGQESLGAHQPPRIRVCRNRHIKATHQLLLLHAQSPREHSRDIRRYHRLGGSRALR